MAFKYCSRHMQNLTAELRRKGMGKLLQDDSDTVRTFAQRWLQGAATRDEFDPRAVAILEINAKALQLLSIQNGCPLCRTEKVLQNSNAGNAWIDNVTDLMLIVAKTNGLVP